MKLIILFVVIGLLSGCGALDNLIDPRGSTFKDEIEESKE